MPVKSDTLTLDERIALLAELGHYLLSGGDETLDQVIRQAHAENQWFTEDYTRFALTTLAKTLLDQDKLRAWAAGYSIAPALHPSRTVGLVMAGNIPLVGFHDWLCVFVAGQRALVKLSDKDKRLLPFLVQKMGEWANEAWEYTHFLQETDHLKGMDAVIATGSNNTARYFEQYFAKYPHIIRRNRNGVAVLDGQESPEEMHALGIDMFMYYGLGCRNVSKLYVPRGYNFEPLLEALHEYREIVLNNKYKNNFDYNFTLFILNNMQHLNNGCLLLREDPSLQSRIASAHYEYYDDLATLEQQLGAQSGDIQCIAGHIHFKGMEVVPFGQTQQPALSDYPDGVDVMQFLTA